MSAMDHDDFLGKTLAALPRPRLGPDFNRRVLAALRAEGAFRRAPWTVPAEASALALASTWMASVAWALLFSLTPERILRAFWLGTHPADAAALAKLQLARGLLFCTQSWSAARACFPAGGASPALAAQWVCAALLAGAILFVVSRDPAPHAAWRKQ